MVVKIAIVQPIKAVLLGKTNAQVPQESFFLIRSNIPSFVSFPRNMKNILFLEESNQEKTKQDSAPQFSQQN